MEGWLSSSIGWIVRGQTNDCYYKMSLSEQTPNWVFCIAIPSQYTIIQVEYLVKDFSWFPAFSLWYIVDFILCLAFCIQIKHVEKKYENPHLSEILGETMRL